MVRKKCCHKGGEGTAGGFNLVATFGDMESFRAEGDRIKGDELSWIGFF